MEKEDILVLGGGITGITAALELGRNGKRVLVVEKGPFLGGHAAGIACKATERCVKCNDCLVEDLLRQFKEWSSARFMTHTVVTDIKREEDSFRVNLSTGPCFIDWSKCNNCGNCYSECNGSRTGAIVKAPSINIRPLFGIDQENCTCLAEGSEAVCIGACVEDAIKILDVPVKTTLEVKGVVVATGYEPYRPPRSNRFGYGYMANVVTAAEIDNMLRERAIVTRPSDGEVPKKVAFVQCVGSRDRQIGREYCSRVCCGYSLRMALRIIHMLPEVDITVFYMDIQNFGKDFEKYYAEVSSKVRLVRALPGDMDCGESDKIVVSYFSEEAGANVTENFDLVILTVGLSPSGENTALAEKLGLDLDLHGFISSKGPEAKGIVVAGTARGPMDVSECITDGKRAAVDMTRYLGDR